MPPYPPSVRPQPEAMRSDMVRGQAIVSVIANHIPSADPAHIPKAVHCCLSCFTSPGWVANRAMRSVTISEWTYDFVTLGKCQDVNKHFRTMNMIQKNQNIPRAIQDSKRPTKDAKNECHWNDINDHDQQFRYEYDTLADPSRIVKHLANRNVKCVNMLHIL